MNKSDKKTNTKFIRDFANRLKLKKITLKS